ncbi:hypothetical protein V6N13_085029 [Hibiscus sabdariffa]
MGLLGQVVLGELGHPKWARHCWNKPGASVTCNWCGPADHTSHWIGSLSPRTLTTQSLLSAYIKALDPKKKNPEIFAEKNIWVQTSLTWWCKWQ